MVNAMARYATHVASVVLPALPVEMASIHRMALQARLVCHCRGNLGRIHYVAGTFSFSTCLSVLIAVCMTQLTFGGARICQEFCALAMSIKGEGLHNGPMTLHPNPSH